MRDREPAARTARGRHRPRRLLAIGERQSIEAVIHLAAPSVGAAGIVDELRAEVNGFLNVLDAAATWGARRVVVASSIGVYGGLADMRALHEDAPLPMTAGGNPVAAVNKSAELLGEVAGERLGVEVASARLAATGGPAGARVRGSSPRPRWSTPPFAANHRRSSRPSARPTPTTRSISATSAIAGGRWPCSPPLRRCGTAPTTSAADARPPTASSPRRSASSSPTSTARSHPDMTRAGPAPGVPRHRPAAGRTGFQPRFPLPAASD